MKKIVVLMPNYLGDSINATSALQLLSDLNTFSSITLVCRAFIAPVFARDDRYNVIVDPRDKLGKYRGSLKLISILKQNKFTTAVLFKNAFYEALLFKLAKISTLIGYNTEGRGFLLTYKCKLNRNRHYINRYACLVNLAFKNKFTILPKTSICHVSKAKNKTKTLNIGFYPGGQVKDVRYYPSTLCSQILQSINQRYSVSFTLIGDEKEFLSNEHLKDTLPNLNITNLAGKTSVTELIDFIANIDLLITIDSAPLHIAANVNTPYVVLVGIGNSPWSIIKPKCGVGVAVIAQGNMINDEDQMRDISPKAIIENIEKLIFRTNIPINPPT